MGESKVEAFFQYLRMAKPTGLGMVLDGAESETIVSFPSTMARTFSFERAFP